MSVCLVETDGSSGGGELGACFGSGVQEGAFLFWEIAEDGIPRVLCGVLELLFRLPDQRHQVEGKATGSGSCFAPCFGCRGGRGLV